MAIHAGQSKEEGEGSLLPGDVRSETSILASVLCKSPANKAALSEVDFNNSYGGIIGSVAS